MTSSLLFAIFAAYRRYSIRSGSSGSSVSSNNGPVGGTNEEYCPVSVVSGAAVALGCNPIVACPPRWMNAEYKIHAHLKEAKRGGRSCFTSVSHRNTALPTWKSSGSRRSSCFLAGFFDGTLCTEITHPSRTPHEPEATKVPFHKSSNGSQPPWQAPPAPACGTDLTQVTTPSHRVVKFISSFKQKQSFPAWHTPRHSWHGNEPDLLIDELRVPTGHPV